MVTMATRDEEPIHDASELLLKLDCFLHELNECKSREYSFKFWRKSQDYESTRLMLISAGEAMSHKITQFSLVGTMNPSVEDLSGVCHALMEHAAQMTVSCQMALHTGIGTPLATCIISSVRRVLFDIKNLVAAVKDRATSNVPMLTGRIWEGAKKLKALPKSNYVSVKRKIFECMVVVRDMFEEFEAETNDSVDLRENTINPVDDDESSTFSDMERERLHQFVQSLKIFRELTPEVIQCLENGTENEDFGWMNSLVIAYDHVHDALIDIGPSFYPPQETDELHSQVKTLQDHILEIFELLQLRSDVELLSIKRHQFSELMDLLISSTTDESCP